MNRKSKSKTEKGHTNDKHKNGHQIDAAAHAMTFAEMLRLQPEVRRRLKLPPWLTFKLPYERKDQAVLTEIEQQRFLCAFNVINSNGALGQLVDIHGEPSHLAHSQQRLKRREFVSPYAALRSLASLLSPARSIRHSAIHNKCVSDS